VSDMTIGELARRTGLAVRTLRYYADAGVLPETSRSESGYRLFGIEAVARARLLRTLRELSVGLVPDRPWRPARSGLKIWGGCPLTSCLLGPVEAVS
jgi:hypothetical protein